MPNIPAAGSRVLISSGDEGGGTPGTNRLILNASAMLLDVQQLAKAYDEKRGLLSTSSSVREGELIAVVGHNVAGKSTLFKLQGDLLVRDSGNVRIDGTSLNNRRALVSKTGLLSETPNLF